MLGRAHRQQLEGIPARTVAGRQPDSGEIRETAVAMAASGVHRIDLTMGESPQWKVAKYASTRFNRHYGSSLHPEVEKLKSAAN